jgi:hypothetical protein
MDIVSIYPFQRSLHFIQSPTRRDTAFDAISLDEISEIENHKSEKQQSSSTGNKVEYNLSLDAMTLEIYN